MTDRWVSGVHSMSLFTRTGAFVTMSPDMVTMEVLGDEVFPDMDVLRHGWSNFFL